MNYKDLPEATEEQTQKFVQKAREFISTTNLYSSSKNIATTAIADYIASQNGLRLLRSK